MFHVSLLLNLYRRELGNFPSPTALIWGGAQKFFKSHGLLTFSNFLHIHSLHISSYFFIFPPYFIVKFVFGELFDWMVAVCITMSGRYRW